MPARRGALPTLEAAKFNLPGFDLASVTNSFALLTGTEGCTTKMWGEYATIVTGESAQNARHRHDLSPYV
jgi:hypothetical protein